VSLFIDDPTPDEPPVGGCCGGDCRCRAVAGLLVIPEGVEFPEGPGATFTAEAIGADFPTLGTP
jgi:hypothetical protein